MLQAMNTGHEGSLSTCHANGPADALARVETMVLMGEVNLPLTAVRAQLQSAIDLVVQVARRPDGQRRVVAVAEVIPPGDSDSEPRDGGEGERVRLLAGPDGVISLPHRPARVAGVPAPDPRWLS
jgi:hypothetical protein